MPRPRKGPRLYLRSARPEKRQLAGWVIKDGNLELGTGCGPEQRQEAEIALGDYIVAKHRPEGQGGAHRGGARDPAEVLIADVLNLYAVEKAPRLADPVSASYRIESLLEFWTLDTSATPRPDGRDGTLAGIRRSTCEAYVAWRTAQPRRSFKDQDKAPRVTDQTARRELEDLSAAIGWFAAEHPLTRRPTVTLPPKAESPRDALSRDQAARLLKAALGYRWDPDLIDAARPGKVGGWIRLGATARTNRQHLRRFLLLGFYTGTRHTVLLKLLWTESPSQAWVDLDAGVIYRRGRRERDHKTKRRPICQIPPRLLSCLRRWKRLDDAQQARMQQRHLDAGGDPARLPQLASVIHFGGAPLSGRIRTGFESLVADADLPPEVTPHWMRHSCATWLMEADVPPWIAAGFMGMTTAMLEDTYGHHRPNHHAETRLGAGGRRRQES